MLLSFFYNFVPCFLYRDAEDAVRGKDGYEFEGHRIRVEFPRGKSGGGGGGDRGGGGGGRGNFQSRGRGPPPRRSDFRVRVTGLPPTGSWQDLKDHMREAGEVLFTDVFKDGTGVVEYKTRDGMKYALKHMDDSKFKSHEVNMCILANRALYNRILASRTIQKKKQCY